MKDLMRFYRQSFNKSSCSCRWLKVNVWCSKIFQKAHDSLDRDEEVDPRRIQTFINLWCDGLCDGDELIKIIVETKEYDVNNNMLVFLRVWTHFRDLFLVICITFSKFCYLHPKKLDFDFFIYQFGIIVYGKC